jgi:flagellum-specific ATP synthase
MDEPIADAARGILDGHIVLSRDLAQLGHYPSIDVLASVSRLMTTVTSEAQREAAKELRAVLATYKKAEDLINIGAYVKGSNDRIDHAINYVDRVNGFLRQGVDEKHSFEETVSLLTGLFSENLVV